MVNITEDNDNKREEYSLTIHDPLQQTVHKDEMAQLIRTAIEEEIGTALTRKGNLTLDQA